MPNLYDPLLTLWGVKKYQSFFYHSAHLHYFTESSLRSLVHQLGFSDSQIQFYFTQDYNLLNHLHWIMNDCPQQDCHIGLAPISFSSDNREMSDWLTSELSELKSRYISRLVSSKTTSNILDSSNE